MCTEREPEERETWWAYVIMALVTVPVALVCVPLSPLIAVYLWRQHRAMNW